MHAMLRRFVAVLAVCLLFLTPTKQARADTLKTDATLIVVAIVAVTAVVTVGIVILVRHKPSLKGCARDEAGGLQLVNEGDAGTYSLIGDVAGIRAGERVRVSGRKKKGTGEQQFIVEKVSKDYGACRAQPVTP